MFYATRAIETGICTGYNYSIRFTVQKLIINRAKEGVLMERFFVSAFGGALSFLVGGWGLLLTVLLILNILDFVTGMAAN